MFKKTLKKRFNLLVLVMHGQLKYFKLTIFNPSK